MDDKVGPAERPSKFAVLLDELERGVRVPLDEQVTEEAATQPVDDTQAWLDSRRQTDSLAAPEPYRGTPKCRSQSPRDASHGSLTR